MRRTSILVATLLAGIVATFGFAQSPVPFINQPLVPDATAPGGPQFTLTVNGTGFVSNSVANWNGSPLATTFVNSSQLTATVPAGDIATASTAWVTVVNPAPGGGTSNTAFFTVTTELSGALAFTPASSPATGLVPSSLAVGDFNGDGKLDLAVANAGDFTVSVLSGDGAGNFAPASSPSTWGLAESIALGDFNGDGKLDLAVASGSSREVSCPTTGTVSILLGDGTGNFALASHPETGCEPASIAVGDFNGDGNLDLATSNVCGSDCNSGTVSILLGDGTGNFTPASTPAVGDWPTAIAAGDFNGDGKLDLAVSNGVGGTVSILLGDGTGNFTLAASPAAGLWPYSLVVGDFNGDGKLDLAVANELWADAVSVLLGDGTGNFTLASTTTVGGFPEALAAGDFNGDGKLDLAVVSDCGLLYGCSSPGTVFTLLGDGTGNFTLASSPATTGNGPRAGAVGDFNGDGMLDIAAANTSGNTVSILLQVPTTTATFSPASLRFATQVVGTTSGPQNVTLSNTGTATLYITSIVASANFSETNTCGSSVAAGTGCTIGVTFVPGSLGTLTGTVTITDNASSSPQTVSLTGAGTLVGLLPASLNFGVQPVGTSSVAQTVTLTNNGHRPLSIAGIRFTGANPKDFVQTNTCGSSVAAGSSCTFGVTFTPTATGSRTATLNVGDNGGGSPQKVALTGTGT